MGSEVTDLVHRDYRATLADLRRLNFWIRADGAWRASALPYWDAGDVLCNVLHGHCPVLPVGTAGAGRAARAPILPLHWFLPFDGNK